MIIVLVFVVLLSCALVVVKPNSKHTIIFVIGFFAINLMIFSLMIYIIKMSNYRYLFAFEFHLYYWISMLKISYFDTKFLMNISISLFLTTMHLFRGSFIKKMDIFKHIVFIMIIGIFLHINSFSFLEQLYLYRFETNDELKLRLIGFVQSSIADSPFLFSLVFCALPYKRFIDDYRNTKMLFRKNHIKMLVFSLGILQIIYFLLLFGTPIKNIVSNQDIYAFTSVEPVYDKGVYGYLPTLFIVMIILLCGILIKYRVFDEKLLNTNVVKRNTARILIKDMRHIFHSYKNSMLMISLLAEKAATMPENERFDVLNQIKGYSTRFSEQASKFLVVYNKPVLKLETISVASCVNDAISRCNATEMCQIKFSEYHGEDIIFGDKEQLAEVFYNTILNASEAIRKKNVVGGCIHITEWCESEYVCVSIKDNGCGMRKQEISNMFKPFFTTNKTLNNWGLGMSQIQRITEAHMGFVDVKSQLGEFTEVQIALLLDKEN